VDRRAAPRARKRIGLQVVIFLIVLSGLLYFTKKKVWHDGKLHPDKLTPRPPAEYRGHSITSRRATKAARTNFVVGELRNRAAL